MVGNRGKLASFTYVGRAFMERLAMVIITFAAVKHALWAILLTDSSSAAMSTPLAAVTRGLPFGVVSDVLLLVMASVLAMWVVLKAKKPTLVTAGLLTPQAIIVLLAAYGATAAIFQGHYADGVERPWQFIAADQINPILIACFHEVAFLRLHRKTILRWQ